MKTAKKNKLRMRQNTKTRGKEEERTKMDDLYSIYSQEITQFRPKYIKAMSLSNSTHLSNDDERGVFAAAPTTARNSSIAVFCFTTTRERHQTTKCSSLDQQLRLIFSAGDLSTVLFWVRKRFPEL